MVIITIFHRRLVTFPDFLAVADQLEFLFSETNCKCTCCESSLLPFPSSQSRMCILDEHLPVKIIVGRLLPQLGDLLVGDRDQPLPLTPRLHRHQGVG